MKIFFYYLLLFASRLARIFRFTLASMVLFRRALEIKGVKFEGKPNYIDYNTYLDPIGGLTLGKNIVISTNVIILTHDYSYTVGLISLDKKPETDVAKIAPVIIGENSFIGAGTIILPGATIGSNVIIGAGSVVTGKVDSNLICAGNPARKITYTDEWARRNEQKASDFSLLIDPK